jgi:hypothetical protein
VKRLLAVCAGLGGLIASGDALAVQCARHVTATVVAHDQPTVFNRLGAQNPNWMMYSLERDLVNKTNGLPCTQGGACTAGNVMLRPDKRTRTMALRVAEGDCLTVTFKNYLAPVANPNNPIQDNLVNDDQVAERTASFHPMGLERVGSMASDGGFVGKNATSLADPGQTRVYQYYAPHEGAFPVQNLGATLGSDQNGGTSSTGLLGMVSVETKGAKIYRSQVTEEELRLATTGTTAGGHPIIDYEATYPATNADGSPSVWAAEGKAGLPILNMITPAGEIVHQEINAVIAGPNADGTFPASTYPLESAGKRNPVYPNRLEPYRSFASIFHDEQTNTQAWPQWYLDPVLLYTLAGVRDGFMINAGSGGIGSEIIANRLHTGPMHDCVDCAYEEFFLASQTVGDPALLVNFPANTGIEQCNPNNIVGTCFRDPVNLANGPIPGNFALFQEDPANIHNGYTGDFAKIRNVHAGPREQHIFHLHNTQWVFNPNDDNSNYLDAQEIMPGSGHTYELTNGGVGNRNKTAGDAIFHCHFYPHFAQGMWYHIRNHDVFEKGTVLAVSGANDPQNPTAGFHTTPFALRSGQPAAGSRAHPDGELPDGVPIPAIVPLPGKPMPPMPGKVSLVAVDRGDFGLATGRRPPNALGQGPDSSQAVIDPTDLAAGKNPGFPFWVAGNECGTPTATDPCPLGIVGQRAPTPPLDMLTTTGASANGYNPKLAGGWDGGLPRHALRGYTSGGVTLDTQNRLDFSKIIERAQPVYFPETGTPVEKVAMAFHAQRLHLSSANNLNGVATTGDFVANGAPPVPGGPFQDPCIDDAGNALNAGVLGSFFDGNLVTPGSPESLTTKLRSNFSSDNPRTYAITNLQIDAVFNKVGYHYPQERIIAIWGDVADLIAKRKPPEPLVMRFASGDCGKILHSNLVPNEFALDDFQVRTPTDIIGQHIHLPKWDLTTNDGAANGWNYEDGSLSPGTVRERIAAINLFNAEAGHAPDLADLAAVPTLTVAQGADPGSTAPQNATTLTPLPHPFFGSGVGGEYNGARVTIQRIFEDPVVNVSGIDRGLGQTFSHDHYGPSTFQQLGLYSTIMAEPAGSLWVHNETGTPLNAAAGGVPARVVTGPGGLTIADGGPTSWQAAILTQPQLAGVTTRGQPCTGTQVDRADCVAQHREFYFEFSDFQHAYEKGVYIGAGPDGRPNGVDPDANTWKVAVNPPLKLKSVPFPDVVTAPNVCPGGVPRPCPEAINISHSSMWVNNFRNEPIGLRVFNPNALGPDGKLGTQTAGLAGDLAFAMQTRTDRAVPQLNTQFGDAPYPAVGSGDEINRDRRLGDPFTPILRSYEGDNVKVKVQSGATEEQHQVSIHGVKWLSNGSGFGKAGNSGWRNFQSSGISEQFAFQMPMNANLGQRGATADYLWSTDTSRDGWWTGVWGVMRNYGAVRPDLFQLPNNPIRGNLVVQNQNQFRSIAGNRVCPTTAPLKIFNVTAVLANDVLRNANGVTIPANVNPTDNVGGPLNPAGGTLVYNPRGTVVPNVIGCAVDINPCPAGQEVVIAGGAGPLNDPTAMMYVRTEDMVDPANPRAGLKPGVPVEPLVLRANAGDCIQVNLTNRLPAVAPDLAGWQDVMWVVNRQLFEPQAARDPLQMHFFNNNLIRPSSYVGMTPQLVEYDITRSEGTVVGINPADQVVGPGLSRTLVWYAGDLTETITVVGNQRRANIVATPVEFGGGNITMADQVKQGQKGLFGSLIIEPAGATVAEDTRVPDRQANFAATPNATRLTRANVTVTSPAGVAGSGGTFREAVMMPHKAINFRWADGRAIEGVKQGELGREGAEDSGHQGVNYAAEPGWFRFKLPPDAPFGNAGTPDSFGALDQDAYYSNTLVAAEPNSLPGGDPATPIFTARPGQATRIHMLVPFATDRDSTLHLAGHVWQRDPFVCNTVASQDAAVPLPGRCNPRESVPSRALGNNPQAKWMGGEEGMGHAYGHWPILVSAGGSDAANLGCTAGQPCDFLYKAWESWGNVNGMWGLLRVTP